jgi:hypothetical protein
MHYAYGILPKPNVAADSLDSTRQGFSSSAEMQVYLVSGSVPDSPFQQEQSFLLAEKKATLIILQQDLCKATSINSSI